MGSTTLEDSSQQRRDPWRHVVLLAGFSFLFIESGILKALGVLMPSLVLQLDSSYAIIGLMTSLSWSVKQLCSIFARLLIKRVNPRLVSITGGLVAGVAMSGTAFLYRTTTMAIFFGIVGVGEGMVSVLSQIFLHEHYMDQYPFASSVMQVGSLSGILLIPILTEKLLEFYGVRGALLLLGGLCLNILPIGAVLKSPTYRIMPASINKTENCPDDATPENCGPDHNGEIHELSPMMQTLDQRATEVNVPRTVKTFNVFFNNSLFFVLVLPAQFLVYFVVVSWMLFLVPYAVSIDIDEPRAVFLSTIGGVGGVVARLSAAVVLKRQPSWCPHVSVLFSLLSTVVLFIQPLGSSYGYLLGCSFVMGVGIFGCSGTMDPLVSLTVRPRFFPTAVAISHFSLGIGGILTSSISGKVFDMTGSFKTVYFVLGGIQVATILLISLLIIIKKRLPRRSEESNLDNQIKLEANNA